mgnify:FL=1
MILLLLGLNNKDVKNGRIMFNNYMGKGFVALRKHKKRYGIQSGKCFRMIHVGLNSYYFEKGTALRFLGNTFGIK